MLTPPLNQACTSSLKTKAPAKVRSSELTQPTNYNVVPACVQASAGTKKLKPDFAQGPGTIIAGFSVTSYAESCHKSASENNSDAHSWHTLYLVHQIVCFSSLLGWRLREIRTTRVGNKVDCESEKTTRAGNITTGESEITSRRVGNKTASLE